MPNDKNVKLLQEIKRKETENELHLRKANMFYIRKKNIRKLIIKQSDTEALLLIIKKYTAGKPFKK